MSNDLFSKPDAKAHDGSVQLFFQRTPEGYPAFIEVSKAIDSLADHWVERIEAGGKHEATSKHPGFELGIRVSGTMSRRDFRKLVASFTTEVRKTIER